MYKTLFVSTLEGTSIDSYFLLNNEYFLAMFDNIEDARKAYEQAVENQITEYNKRLVSTKELK